MTDHTVSPADANTADLDSAVGIIEGVQHALALTKGARATAEERVYTTEANRLIHEKRERMLQARLTDGTTAGRTYARTGGDEHATTAPVAAAGWSVVATLRDDGLGNWSCSTDGCGWSHTVVGDADASQCAGRDSFVAHRCSPVVATSEEADRD